MLRRNRPEPTPLKLDEMKQTAQARARGRSFGGGLRQRFVTALLVAGLTVGGGGAVVLAKNGGGNDGNGNGNHGQYCPNDLPKGHDCGKRPKCPKDNGKNKDKDKPPRDCDKD